jgi:hypothetical protein
MHLAVFCLELHLGFSRGFQALDWEQRRYLCSAVLIRNSPGFYIAQEFLSTLKVIFGLIFHKVEVNALFLDFPGLHWDQLK